MIDAALALFLQQGLAINIGTRNARLEPHAAYAPAARVEPDGTHVVVFVPVIGAAAILVPTYSGRTASAVARHRPRRPIIAVTHKRQAVQQLALEWGVVSAEIEEAENVEHLWSRAIEAARETGLVAAGDRIVLTAGTAVNVPGTTNVIKVETA